MCGGAALMGQEMLLPGIGTLFLPIGLSNLLCGEEDIRDHLNMFMGLNIMHWTCQLKE